MLSFPRSIAGSGEFPPVRKIRAQSKRAINTMKFNQILLTTIATGSLILGSHINAAHAGLARGTDLQIHRSIDNESTSETETSGDRTRSMEAVKIGWSAYEKDEYLTALEYFQKAIELDDSNPYGYMGLALVTGKTSEEGPVFMAKAAELFQKENNQPGYDAAIKWLESIAQN
jgi:tetratricopeptide (TPR) repeat protein